MEEIHLLLTLFDRSIKQQSLYGQNHPLTISCIEEFERKLKSLFGENKSLRFQVKRGSLEYDKKEVFRLEKRDANYLQEMYIDGIRELEFLPNLTRAELASFIAVLARDLQLYEGREDDTVTLIWKGNLSGIRVSTVDVYAGELNALLRETLSIEEDENTSSEEKNYLETFIKKLIDPVTSDPSKTTLKESNNRDLAKELNVENLENIPNEMFHKDPETQKQIAAEIERSNKRKLDPELRMLLGEVLERKSNESEFEKLLEVYLQTSKNHLDQGKVETCLEWLQELKEIETLVAQNHLFVQAAIQEQMQRIFSNDYFQELSEKFNSGLPSQVDSWLQLFDFMNGRAAIIAIEFLKNLSPQGVRTALIDYLHTKGSQQIENYLPHLKTTNPTFLRDLIHLLQRFPENKQVLTAFRSLAVFPNAGVRSEVILAMKSFQGPVVQEIIERGLKDQDSEVRKSAFHWIGKTRSQNFAKPLALLANEPNFRDRSFEEKKLHLQALGRCAREAALEFLIDNADSSGLDVPDSEIRQAALYGILEIRTPKAIEYLESAAHKFTLDREFKDLAQKLSERVQKGEDHG